MVDDTKHKISTKNEEETNEPSDIESTGTVVVYGTIFLF